MSPNGQMLTARIPCRDQGQAVGVMMFLEGVRSLLMLQAEGNATLVGILKDIVIKNDGSEAVLNANASRLLDLWVPASKAEATVPQAK